MRENTIPTGKKQAEQTEVNRTGAKSPADEYKKGKESEAGGAPVVHSTGHWDRSLLSIRIIIIMVVLGWMNEDRWDGSS